jgi:hypothetical protein
MPEHAANLLVIQAPPANLPGAGHRLPDTVGRAVACRGAPAHAFDGGAR